MYFILIIISLILGFFQGIKLKRKKLIIEISKLEETNKQLTNKIEKMELKNHLAVYDIRTSKKGDKTVFQQHLVSYLSSNPLQKSIVFYGFTELISAIIKSNNAIDLQTQVNSNEFQRCSDKYLESIQRFGNDDEIAIKVNINERNYELNFIDTLLNMNKDLFISMKIEKYDLNYEELISSIKIAIEIVITKNENNFITPYESTGGNI